METKDQGSGELSSNPSQLSNSDNGHGGNIDSASSSSPLEIYTTQSHHTEKTMKDLFEEDEEREVSSYLS